MIDPNVHTCEPYGIPYYVHTMHVGYASGYIHVNASLHKHNVVIQVSKKSKVFKGEHGNFACDMISLLFALSLFSDYPGHVMYHPCFSLLSSDCHVPRPTEHKRQVHGRTQLGRSPRTWVQNADR